MLPGRLPARSRNMKTSDRAECRASGKRAGGIVCRSGAAVWQSQPHWAQAAGLRYEPRGQELAPAFVPSSLQRPRGTWDDFELQLTKVVSGDSNCARYGITAGSILAVVARPELLGLRTKALKALQVAAASPLVSDLDLRGYSRSEPGWIAHRIACLVTALELTRLAANSRPMLPSVRALVEESA